MSSMSRLCGLLASLAPFALAAACSDPELESELDTEGPPEVVEVNVASETAPADPNNNRIEAATFCRPGAQYKVSTFYCPLERNSENEPIPGDRELDEPVTDATPVDWHARFIFSELLDPDVEDLVTEDGVTTGTIAETRPASLSCGGTELEYDGWYDPTGNYQSYPPGPSLVVHAVEFIATGTICEVSLADSVVDKDGDAVPGDHRGPYEFAIAALSVTGSVPENESEGVAVDSEIEISFNAPIDADTVTTEKIVVTAGDTPVAGTLALKTDEKTGDVSNQIIVFDPDADLEPGTDYTVTVSDDIADIAGGLLAQEEPFTATFTTGE
jgi:Bacterial Ig-like domain